LPNLAKLALQGLHGAKYDALELMPIGIIVGNDQVKPGMKGFPERPLHEGSGTGQPPED
jgi:hypothetical protein